MPSPAPAELTGRVLVSLAFAEAEQGRVPVGLSLLDRAQRVLPESESGLLFGQRGLLLLRTGQPADAVVAFDAALARLAAGRHATDRAKALLNRSVALLLVGRSVKAGTDLAECREIADRLGLVSVAVKAVQNEGLRQLLAGNLPAALGLYTDAAARCADELPSYLPVIGVEKAQVLIAAGLTTDADRELAEALDLLSRQRVTVTWGEAELARSQLALLIGDVGAARRWAALAGRRFRRRQDMAWSNLATLAGIQAAFAGRARPGALARRCASVSARLSAAGLFDDARTARLLGVRALVRAGRHIEAGEAMNRLGRLRPTDPLRVRILWWLAAAELAEAVGDRRRYWRDLRTAFGSLHRYRSEVGSVDLLTSAATHGQELSRHAIRAALADGRPPVVFSWAERTRAQMLRLSPPRPPEDTRLAASLEELRQVQFALRQAELNRHPTTALRSRRAELERAVRERSWRQDGTGGSSTGLASLAQTRAVLGDRALVMYVRDHTDLFALTITSAGAAAARLGDYGVAAECVRRLRVDLDLLAADVLPTRLARIITASAGHNAVRLTEHILTPLMPRIGDRSLVILPTGALHGVPWMQLPGCRQRPVVVAPSATAWLAAETRRRLARSGNGRTVLVAGPGLDHADTELARLNDIHPTATVLTAAAATPAATLAAIDGSALAHLAAHGNHQPDSPLFSTLELAGGSLMGYDLHGLRQPPGHVVLSACDVGTVSVRHGDEVLGMAAALLWSGSTTVVASVARIADRTGPDIMDTYHRALRRGEPPAQALASATATAPVTPFVCFGAG
jgi:tetratricopeptide (TPR) repeat protein